MTLRPDMGSSSPDDVGKLIADLQRLEMKRHDLIAQLEFAKSVEAKAREAQRNFLETGNLDTSESAELSAAVEDAVSGVAAVNVAIFEITGHINETQRRLVAAQQYASSKKR